MSKQWLLSFALLIIMVHPSWAQDEYPKFEGFAGFSVLSFGVSGDDDFDLNRDQFFGWQASAAANLHRNFGLVFDFGGQYEHFEVDTPGPDEDDVFLQNYQFMAGPRIYGRGDRATGFVHFLAGGGHAGVIGFEGQEPEGTTGLGLALGGGVDINIGDPGGVGVRLLQFDWIPQRYGGVWFNDTVRFGIGLVFQGGS